MWSTCACSRIRDARVLSRSVAVPELPSGEDRSPTVFPPLFAGGGSLAEEEEEGAGGMGRPLAEDDSHDLITCFCLKPFAGRPMIECSECLTWIHLSCAKIRRNNIPDEFTCQRCREAKHTTRRSQRIRAGGNTPPQRRRPST